MYDVVKILNKLNHIVIYESGSFSDSHKDYPLLNTEFHLGISGTTTALLHRPKVRIPKVFNNCYNNGRLIVPGLTGELQIFQNYGDRDDDVPSGYTEVDREFVVAATDLSVGWYDGYLCLVGCQFDSLIVYKLVKHNSILVPDYCSKRPFNLKFLVEDDYNMDSRIKGWIELQFYNEIPTEIVWFDTPYTYKDVFNPNAFSDALTLAMQLRDYSGQVDVVKSCSKYFTNYNLIDLGFSYNAKTHRWTKDKIIIYSEDYNYHQLLRDNTGKYYPKSMNMRCYLWYTNEIKALINGSYFERINDEWKLIIK